MYLSVSLSLKSSIQDLRMKPIKTLKMRLITVRLYNDQSLLSINSIYYLYLIDILLSIDRDKSILSILLSNIVSILIIERIY